MISDPGNIDVRAKARDFHDQFLLCRTAPETPEGWRKNRLGDWHLFSHPSLPVVRLLAPDGTAAGFALGHPIDPGGRVAHGSLQVPGEAGATTPSPTTLENWIYSFGGRFIFIVLMNGIERVYLDPGGTLPTVWSESRQRVASTTSLLLLDEPHHPMFRIGPADFPLNRHSQFFPAGLTAAEGVSRVLANHCLDLGSWRAIRHHPRAAYEYAAESEIPGLIARFTSIVRRQIGAAVQECGGAYLALTAGEDSRRVLACGRDFVDRIECVSLRSNARAARVEAEIDVLVPARLTKRVGVRHRVLPMSLSDPSQLTDYSLRIGYSGGSGKAWKFWNPPMGHLDLSRAFLTGHMGHVAKAKYADQLETLTKPTPQTILANMHLRQLPGFAEALDRWLASAPDGPPSFYRDLCLVEVGVSGWLCTHLYGFAPFRMLLLPFCHRDAIDAMLRLPPRFRTGGNVARATLELAWPELLALPFNRCTGLKHLEHRARKWLRQVEKSRAAARRKVEAKRIARRKKTTKAADGA